MDINKLSTSEKIIAVSGIVLFISSFLPWFSVEAGGISYGDGNGWDVGFLWGGIPTLLGLVMVAHVVLSNFAENVNLPDLPWARVHMIAGIVAAALVVLKLLIGEDADGAEALGVDITRSYGLFLATIAALGLAAGGFLYNREKTGTATTM